MRTIQINDRGTFLLFIYLLFVFFFFLPACVKVLVAEYSWDHSKQKRNSLFFFWIWDGIKRETRVYKQYMIFLLIQTCCVPFIHCFGNNIKQRKMNTGGPPAKTGTVKWTFFHWFLWHMQLEIIAIKYRTTFNEGEQRNKPRRPKTKKRK